MLLIIGILIMLVLPTSIFYGHYRFYNMVDKEVQNMFNNLGNTEKVVTKKDLAPLPKKLRDYLMKVGIIDACSDCHATFKQTGRIKTGQDKKWIDFTAKQYMTADIPCFIWSAKSFPIFIRDKSVMGKGEVKVSLMGMKEIAKSDTYKTDQSALVRCLGELLFYPVGFLSDAITWKNGKDGSLKAVIIVNGTEAEGSFFFNEEGLLNRFESKRYMDKSLENFTGIAEDYKKINGRFIPTKMRAIWNLKSGDFEYFNCTISDYRIE